jgi:hypothetical protein
MASRPGPRSALGSRNIIPNRRYSFARLTTQPIYGPLMGLATAPSGPSFNHRRCSCIALTARRELSTTSRLPLSEEQQQFLDRAVRGCNEMKMGINLTISSFE